MADWPVKSLGDKTLLQYAKTPYMDKLARMGRNGRLITVAEGFHPGSEVANMSVLGYNLPKVYEGRGPLEAASIGVDLKPGEMAMRCNLICVEGEILKNHSSGHISTEEADVLIQYLQEKLGNDRVRFHTGVQYRHLLVIKGGNKELDCTPPHDVPLKPFRPLMVKPSVPEAQETAGLINDLILQSQELLKNHPLNLKRIAEGKDPANSIWPWSPGYRPQMPTFSETFPQVKKGAVISAVDLINGIGYYAGLRRITVQGATGLYDTIWSLIGPYVAFAVPISVFILTSFMKEIPREIEESAEIDGCGKIQMFFSMILPLSKPGMATLAIYNGVNMWNEFSFVNTLTQSAQNRTLPLAIWEFQGQYSMNTPMIMAVLTLTLLPMVIMFIIFQDKLVKGMTAGAVKG